MNIRNNMKLCVNVCVLECGEREKEETWWLHEDIGNTKAEERERQCEGVEWREWEGLRGNL